MKVISFYSGENYHIEQVEGSIQITFSEGEKYYKALVVDGVVGEKTLIGEFDERVKLSSNKYAKRIKDYLVIYKEVN